VGVTHGPQAVTGPRQPAGGQRRMPEWRCVTRASVDDSRALEIDWLAAHHLRELPEDGLSGEPGTEDA
jgi:hypothetical protein